MRQVVGTVANLQIKSKHPIVQVVGHMLVDGDHRVFPPELTDPRRQPQRGYGRRRTDGDDGVLTVGAQAPQGIGNITKAARQNIEQSGAVRRQFNAPMPAMKHVDANLFFQRLDLMTHGARRNVELLRRQFEAAPTGRRFKRPPGLLEAGDCNVCVPSSASAMFAVSKTVANYAGIGKL